MRKENTYQDRFYTTGMTGYPGAIHIPEREPGKQKDFSDINAVPKNCQPPKERKMALSPEDQLPHRAQHCDKVVEALNPVPSTLCGDGRLRWTHAHRKYFTEVAEKQPKTR
jgi:hydroxylamine reductase